MTASLTEGELVNFDMKKAFKYIKKLGEGGTGDTYLFKDETTDMMFAFKKYVPKEKEYEKENYERFVNEIKILFKLSHPNIVRVYNYYLYPEYTTGYLQMEYVEGISIDKYNPKLYEKDWNSIFVDIIDAFNYLEKNKILHRDIRSSNILITYDGTVKIIDFGFGKMVNLKNKDKNSIFLNWPVTEMPQEVDDEGKYTYATEIFFLGKLLKKIILEINGDTSNFIYRKHH